MNRFIKSFVTIGGLMITSLIGTFCFMLPNVLLLKYISESWHFKVNAWISAAWYKTLIFIFETWNGIQIRVSGDDIPNEEAALLMMNHPSEIDWLFIFVLGLRKGALANIKVILKEQIRLVPFIGWGCENLEFIYLSRNWEEDESHLKYKLDKYKQNDFNPWVVIFPEGTDIDPEKLAKSWSYSDRFGYPKFNNVLLPRTKGVQACLDGIRDRLTSVYDITLSYDCGKPTIGSLMTGKNPKIVNIHVTRIPMSTVPKTEETLQPWLFDMYDKKDKLLANYKQTGSLDKNYQVYKQETSTYVSAFTFTYLSYEFTKLFMASGLFKLYILFGFIFYILTSTSRQFRVLRQLELPRIKSKKSTSSSPDKQKQA